MRTFSPKPTDIQRAWDSADRYTLRRLVAPDLLREWERRLDDFEFRGWRNRVKPLDQPTIEYVGINHRGGGYAYPIMLDPQITESWSWSNGATSDTTGWAHRIANTSYPYNFQFGNKGFGNGRLARNLFEAAVARQASRIVTVKDPTDAELCALTPHDVEDLGAG